MTTLGLLLSRRRLLLALPTLLALAGLVSWWTIPRQEDPRLPARWAFLVAPYPDATAVQVERRVLDKLEKHLAEVEEIARIDSTARAGAAIVEIELDGEIYDTDRAWDEVRRALDEARREIPDEVEPFRLNEDVVTPESIVLALTGPTDVLELVHAARGLKHDLLALACVKRIRIVGDPGEQIVVRLDEAATRRVAIGYRSLAEQLTLRNSTQPPGSLRIANRGLSLRVHSEFESIEEIRESPLRLRTGATIPLGSIATVRRQAREPPLERMRFEGLPAVGLAVSPETHVDMLELGRAVRAQIRRVKDRYPGIAIHEAMFQPDRVERRIDDLASAFSISLAIVAGVLFVTMGIRSGLVVAAVIPVVVLSTLAVYAMGGGSLHQLSIAAFVISLGLIVDNAIVMTDAMDAEIARGRDPGRAAEASVRALALPLAASTGTTLATFAPMILATGTTADFARAIPIVVGVGLTLSYGFAMGVSPALSPALRGGRVRESRVALALTRWLGSLALRQPACVLVATLVAVLVCAAATPWVKQRFFPASDRNQLVVTVELPEGSHFSATDQAAHKLETHVLRLDRITSVSTFVGRAAPLFYYNLNRRPSSPHLAQLVVSTSSTATLAALGEEIRRLGRTWVPEAWIAVRRLEQGMPIDAPIEIRVSGSDRASRESAAEQVLRRLREIPGTVDARDDRGIGAPGLHFEVNDSVAIRYGIQRLDVAAELLARSRGIPVGRYRAEGDPVPIVVRSSGGERFPVSRLSQIDIARSAGAPIPLAQLARAQIEWNPSTLHHHNRQPTITVSSQLREGATAETVLWELQRGLPKLGLPGGVTLEIGGEAEGSAAAYAELLRYVPIAIGLQVAFILLVFNSFRLLAIVLATLPLAAIGIVPGLVLSGQPFGFMSVLGVLALLGVAVNNAIVLLDAAEQGRSEGRSLEQAMTEAIHSRTRPVLVTAATTIAGLLPLAFSHTHLWPPMAWAMISGLASSTLLTFMVVPAAYRMVFSGDSAEVR